MHIIEVTTAMYPNSSKYIKSLFKVNIENSKTNQFDSLYPNT